MPTPAGSPDSKGSCSPAAVIVIPIAVAVVIAVVPSWDRRHRRLNDQEYAMLSDSHPDIRIS
jgi:hypothetical protein